MEFKFFISSFFTNDKDFADVCRSIRVHGQGIDKYDNIRIGLNSRLDALQAVVLLNKLEIFDQELILRNKIANYYSNKLESSYHRSRPDLYENLWWEGCITYD